MSDSFWLGVGIMSAIALLSCVGGYISHLRSELRLATECADSWRHSCGKCNDRLAKVRGAIFKHRDARGHDRCWLNDLELYRALGDEHVPSQSDVKLPCLPEFMKECGRYWETHQPHGDAGDLLSSEACDYIRQARAALQRVHEGKDGPP